MQWDLWNINAHLNLFIWNCGTESAYISNFLNYILCKIMSNCSSLITCPNVSYFSRKSWQRHIRNETLEWHDNQTASDSSQLAPAKARMKTHIPKHYNNWSYNINNFYSKFPTTNVCAYHNVFWQDHLRITYYNSRYSLLSCQSCSLLAAGFDGTRKLGAIISLCQFAWLHLALLCQLIYSKLGFKRS